MSHQPDNIFAGTQVVSLVEVRGPNHSLVHPRGVRCACGFDLGSVVRFQLSPGRVVCELSTQAKPVQMNNTRRS